MSKYLTRDESHAVARRFSDTLDRAWLDADRLAVTGFNGLHPVLDLTDDERAALREVAALLTAARDLVESDRLARLVYTPQEIADTDDAVASDARRARQAQNAWLADRKRAER